MTKQLSCSVGQYSDQGRKEFNQDSHGFYVPSQPHLNTKGICLAIADGISSSAVSHIASQVAVKSFLEDYYCTSETWSVKTAARRVLLANNSWLFAHNQRSNEFRLNRDTGYVCTFTGIVFKSATAYLFHVGDAQLYRIRDKKITVLTQQHRVNLSPEKSYLSRALGVTQALEIDYQEIALKEGDVFFLATDGVYEYVADEVLLETLESDSSDLDLVAKKLAGYAFDKGSADNLTAQIIRIDQLPTPKAGELLQHLRALPFPPELQPRMIFDGYKIIRDLHNSSRSHALLASDLTTNQKVVIKCLATDARTNEQNVERFMMEEWIAKRINNAHILKPHQANRSREFCYVVTEFIEGKTLAQWMIDNPAPSLHDVRVIIEQIAIGLQAFHRQEMLHQDIRPNNIMIDTDGTVKIIDFGSTRVSGIEEAQLALTSQTFPGTAQFLAPEYFLGEFGTKQSDIYSLACVAYQMLCGRTPYGTAVAKALTRADQQRLVYQSVLDEKSELPAWVDLSLKKALQANPHKRYQELSEFVQDLRKPNAKFLAETRPPLIERDPVRVWQGISMMLCVLVIYLLVQQ